MAEGGGPDLFGGVGHDPSVYRGAPGPVIRGTERHSVPAPTTEGRCWVWGGGTGGGGKSSKGGSGDGWEKIAAPANSQGSQGGGGGGGGGAGVAAAKAGKGKKGVGSAFDALMGA